MRPGASGPWRLKIQMQAEVAATADVNSQTRVTLRPKRGLRRIISNIGAPPKEVERRPREIPRRTAPRGGVSLPSLRRTGLAPARACPACAGPARAVPGATRPGVARPGVA